MSGSNRMPLGTRRPWRPEMSTIDTKRQILVVDDDAIVLRSISKALLRAGYDLSLIHI